MTLNLDPSTPVGALIPLRESLAKLVSVTGQTKLLVTL